MMDDSDFKAVVLDLDGTLCDEGNIHQKDEEVLRRVLDKGLAVIPATTRMRYSTSRILVDLDVDRFPLVCNKGARAIGPGWKDGFDYEDWYEVFLDRKVAEELASYADENEYEITTIFKEKKFWHRSRIDRGDKSDEITQIVDKNTDALSDGTPISFMMHAEGNGKRALKDFESFAQDFSDSVKIDRHHRSGKFVTLTIYPEGVSKKKALDVVFKKIDISFEEILAIGDDEVDLEMLKSARKGIAMGNSPQHVKNFADEIAPSCSEQGVSWALEKYVL